MDFPEGNMNGGIMNITVYCGSNFGHNPIYRETAEKFGEWIGENGHSLVYGASGNGLMGAISDNVLKHNGKVYGVFAEVLYKREGCREDLTETFIVPSIRERKKKMIELGEVFIAFPGGPGTIEEISEVISLARINVVKEKCIIFNLNGFYDPLKILAQKMLEEGFVKREEVLNVKFIDTFEELTSYIEAIE